MFCLSIKSHSYYSDVDQVQQENFDQVQHLQQDVDQVQHLVFDQVQHLVFDQVQPAQTIYGLLILLYSVLI